MSDIPIALTIAGSDSSGGAGIQADLKTFAAHRVYGASVITALTAQNTQGVSAVHAAPADFVKTQMQAVFSDLDVRAVKIGMTGTVDVVEAIADGLEQWCRVPVILDPVMVATSGDLLLEPDAIEVLRTKLIPRAELITPNLSEAAVLLGGQKADSPETARAQAQHLTALGAAAVLLKGGHGTGPEATDYLVTDGTATELTQPWIKSNNTHGTGCTLSAAIAANQAKGHTLLESVEQAKTYVTAALRYADRLKIGTGHGPLHHLYEWDAH